MTPIEMAQACARAITATQEMGFPMEQSHIQLTTSGAWKKPPRFPRGRLNIVHPDGRRVWTFNAANVLAWLAGSKMIEINYVPVEGGTQMEIKEIRT